MTHRWDQDTLTWMKIKIKKKKDKNKSWRIYKNTDCWAASPEFLIQ